MYAYIPHLQLLQRALVGESQYSQPLGLAAVSNVDNLCCELQREVHGRQQRDRHPKGVPGGVAACCPDPLGAPPKEDRQPQQACRVRVLTVCACFLCTQVFGLLDC